MKNQPSIDLSLVIPIKNESEQIKPLLKRLDPILTKLALKTEILFINDGSADDSLAILRKRQKQDKRIAIIDLSRNFGKEAALAAGMHYARGDAIITMDADGQDPPELIPDFVARWREGFEMVVAQRTDRQSDGVIKHKSADWFYRLFNSIGDTQLIPHAGDFRLFDRKVIEAYRLLGERNRFNKGLFAWLGFKQTTIAHRREPSGRASRWPSGKLFMLALDAFLSFSTIPIRIWTVLGVISAFSALGFAFYIIISTLLYGSDIEGYASLMVMILMIGGINMIGIGILGEYISRTFTESKQRPLYIIRAFYRDDD